MAAKKAEKKAATPAAADSGVKKAKAKVRAPTDVAVQDADLFSSRALPPIPGDPLVPRAGESEKGRQTGGQEVGRKEACDEEGGSKEGGGTSAEDGIAGKGGKACYVGQGRQALKGSCCEEVKGREEGVCDDRRQGHQAQGARPECKRPSGLVNSGLLRLWNLLNVSICGHMLKPPVPFTIHTVIAALQAAKKATPAKKATAAKAAAPAKKKAAAPAEKAAPAAKKTASPKKASSSKKGTTAAEAAPAEEEAAPEAAPAKKASGGKKGSLSVGDKLPDFSVETDTSTADKQVLQASQVMPMAQCQSLRMYIAVELWK